MKARYFTIVFSLLLLESLAADTPRSIPDDNLAYPVLIMLRTGGTGSGFFLNTTTNVYLVTARHVLMDGQAASLQCPIAELISYSGDPDDRTSNRMLLDLGLLFSNKCVNVHKSSDVMAIKLFTSMTNGVPCPRGQMAALPGVAVVQASSNGVVGVKLGTVKRYDDVLVANEVYLFGNPSSLGIQEQPQLDPLRPLLRKGIVAALNDKSHSIVLDCPAYPGSSGGPVLEVESDRDGRQMRVIGVVCQFVPSAEVWVNASNGFANRNLSNSGYSIATPMDPVLELIGL